MRPLPLSLVPAQPLKERIDKLLVDRGLVESRQKAQALILAGQILVNEQRIDKVGDKVLINAEIRIKGEQLKYASRAGLKLEGALNHFQIDVKNFHCLDIGASTGGFTDCLLQHGAAHVIALDVGHSQIVWKLRQDNRVEIREGVNARYLQPADFAHSFDLITIDVSFISLTKILPAVVDLLKPDGRLITLIKPQFEVGRGEVGKGGIVNDPEKHKRVLKEILSAAAELALYPQAVITSPIAGMDGNKEFLACYDKFHQHLDIDNAIAQLF